MHMVFLSGLARRQEKSAEPPSSTVTGDSWLARRGASPLGFSFSNTSVTVTACDLTSPFSFLATSWYWPRSLSVASSISSLTAYSP